MVNIRGKRMHILLCLAALLAITQSAVINFTNDTQLNTTYSAPPSTTNLTQTVNSTLSSGNTSAANSNQLPQVPGSYYYTFIANLLNSSSN
jgi:hypothetical protein